MKRSDNTWYWLTLALVTALALVYILRHDLKGRYEDYRRTVDTVAEQREQLQLLREMVASEQQRAEGMDRDPLEQEATIRRVKRLVREGEIVFRVEERPPVATPTGP
jgi:cell division protein FtsB